MNKWIYTEDMGREQFYIAQTDMGLWFVILDKHGIANIFDCMEELAKYFEGDLECMRECIEPFDTGIEGVDFLDVHFDIKE
jgi:hypothetical protein